MMMSKRYNKFLFVEMEELIDIEIIDFDQKETLLEVALNPKSTLLDARKELEESDVAGFVFVNQKGVKIAEKSKTVEKTITNEKQLFIRFLAVDGKHHGQKGPSSSTSS
jgi:hypothetical protein